MCVVLYLRGLFTQSGEADELIGIPAGAGGSLRELSWLNLGEEAITPEQEHAVEAAAGYAAVGEDGVYTSLADGDASGSSLFHDNAKVRAMGRAATARCRLRLTALTCKASAYMCCILLGPGQLALGIMCLSRVGGDGAYCGAGSVVGSGAALVVVGCIFCCCLQVCLSLHSCCCVLPLITGVDVLGDSGTTSDLEAAQGVARAPCRACGYENATTLTHCVMCEELLESVAADAQMPAGSGTSGAGRPPPPLLTRQHSWARTLDEGDDGALSIRFSRVDDDDVAGGAAAGEGAAAGSAAQSSTPRRIGGGLVRSFASDAKTLEWHSAIDGYAVAVGGAAHGDADAAPLAVNARQVQHQLEAVLRIFPMKFGVKRKWFNAQMAQLRGSARHRTTLRVNRADLLGSSMDKVLAMSAAEFGGAFKVNFDGEAGIDLGGVTTDWVEQVIAHLFECETGLFEQSQLDNIAYQLKPRALAREELCALQGTLLLPTRPSPMASPIPSVQPTVGMLSADEIEALYHFGEFAGLDVSSTDSTEFRTACYFCESSGFIVVRALDRYLHAQSGGDPASVVPRDYSPSGSSSPRVCAAPRQCEASMRDGPLAGRKRADCYRFAGRMVAKALRTAQPSAARLTRPLLKHMIGVPISVSDLQFVDVEAYTRMLSMYTMDADEMDEMYLDMTTIYVDEAGHSHVVELKPGGKDEAIGVDNLDECVFCLSTSSTFALSLRA